MGINIIEAAQCLNSINRCESDEEMRLELDDNSNDSNNNKDDLVPSSINSIESTLRNAVDFDGKLNKNSDSAVNFFRKSTSNGNLNFDSTSKSNKDPKVVQRETKSILF
jgi:hypothetical protein